MRKFFSSAVVLALFAAPAMAQSFGSAVAVSGKQIIAGGRTSQIEPGVLYTYTMDDGKWSETGSIAAEGAEGPDGFGRSVAVSGSLMIVGAPEARSVYFFHKNSDGSWTQEGHAEVDENGFGSAVAISDNLALVGAPAGRRSEAVGTVYAYRKNDSGSWVLSGTLTAEEVASGGGYGSVLVIDGTDAAVGAPRANSRTGAVYTFNFDTDQGQWIPTGSVVNEILGEGSAFGTSMLIMDGYLAVGSPGYDRRSGIVSIFKLDDEGEWSFSERVSPFSATGDESFGSAIGWADNSLWIGASGANGRQGVIYRFGEEGDEENLRLANTWIQEGKYLQASSSFGSKLAMNDEIAVVTASGHDNRAGVIFPMVLTNGEWVQGGPQFHDPEGYESVTDGMVECKDDMAGAFPCKDVNMTSFLSMGDLGADRGVRTNDIWGWEDPETGREYAIVGLSNQTSFVDVSDPFSPIYLGKLPMPSTARSSVWRDMKVYKNHAFIVSDGAGEHGMQVFDLTQLRNIDSPPVLFEETAHYSEIFSAHNIVINEESGFAYSVGSSSGGETCGGGLHMINIQDPAHPVFAGCFADGASGRRGTGYSHDAQCVMYHGPDPDYTGHEICLGSNETALSISDVTDKDNPVSISIATYPKVAYAHQGWLTDDHTYFYMNDEGDEPSGLVEGTRTLVWDLTDLDEPELVAEHIASTTETDHNLYIKGNLMYQSNYGAGFRVLDISNPVDPVEVAYFDTSPVGGGGGSWSNYPFFQSGTLIVTGGSTGLFILKKKDVDI